jgi:LTXXQ motif family protein
MAMTAAWRCLLAAVLAASPAAAELSGYAGQRDRPVKALSEQETADLLAGRGMGLAKAAELNRYPGPRHVLDLGAALKLTEPQRRAVEAAFERMQASARSLGGEILAREAALDRLFADARIDLDQLAAATAAIARLQGELRRVHLAAHLETRALLTVAQVEGYDTARGYSAGGAGRHGMQHH